MFTNQELSWLRTAVGIARDAAFRSNDRSSENVKKWDELRDRIDAVRKESGS